MTHGAALAENLTQAEILEIVGVRREHERLGPDQARRGRDAGHG